MGAITARQKKDCPHHFEAPGPSVQKVGQDEPQGDLDGNGYPDHLRRVGERHPVVPRSQDCQEFIPAMNFLEAIPSHSVRLYHAEATSGPTTKTT